MFKCELSGRVSVPGEKPVRVVLETRERIYTVKTRDNKDKEIGRGTEIVREALVCREVADQLAGKVS